jgi:hypothetical protein
MLESAAVGANPHVFSILSPHSVPAFSAFHKQKWLAWSHCDASWGKCARWRGILQNDRTIREA